MTNPYLRLLRGEDEESTAPAGIRNPYLQRLENDRRAEEQERARVLNNAFKVNPDEEAELRQLHDRGKQSVMPSAPADSAIGRLQSAFPVPPSPNLIQDKAQFKTDLTMRELMANISSAPALKRKYTQEDFARIASDDSMQLSMVERTLKGIGGRGLMTEFPRATMADLAFRKVMGETLSLKDEGRLLDATARVNELTAEQEGRGAISYVLNTAVGSTLGQFITGTPAGAAGAAVGAGTGIAIGAGAALVGGQAGPQIATPEEFVTVPAFSLTGALVGARRGYAAGLAIHNFRQIAGLSYLEYSNYRDINGQLMDPDIARGAALVVGALSTGTETFADITLSKSLPGFEKFLGKGGKEVAEQLLATDVGRSALSKLGRRVAETSGVEAVTEGVQGVIEILGGEAAKGIAEGEFAPITLEEAGARVGESVLQGAIGGAGVPIVTAPVSIPVEQYFINRQAAYAALEERSAGGQLNRLQSAVDAAAQSKLVKRDRAALEEFVNEAAEGTELSNVFIAPDSFAQVAEELGVDVMELARQLGVADQVQDSALTSTPITMPVGKFIATVADTDLAGPLMEVAKLNPFLPSRAEIKAAQEAGEDQFVARAEALAAAVAQDETVRVEAEAISARIVGEMTAVGRFTGNANRVYATAATQMYVQLAQRLGISPQQAFDNYPLRVAGQRIGGQPEGQVLASSRPQIVSEAQQASTKQLLDDMDRIQQETEQQLADELDLRLAAIDEAYQTRMDALRARDTVAEGEAAYDAYTGPLFDALDPDSPTYDEDYDTIERDGRDIERDVRDAAEFDVSNLEDALEEERTAQEEEIYRFEQEEGLNQVEEFRRQAITDLFDEFERAYGAAALADAYDVYGEYDTRERMAVTDDGEVISLRELIARRDETLGQEAADLRRAQALLASDPAALGLTPEQVESVNPIYRPDANILPAKRLKSNKDAARLLERVFAAPFAAIKDFTAKLTNGQIEHIAKIMAAEVQLALLNTGNASTWYSTSLERTMDVVGLAYPMLLNEQAAIDAGLGSVANARFVFTYILAVTSQNLTVSDNSRATLAAFDQMLERIQVGDYTMSADWGTGDKQVAMGQNFEKFAGIVSAMPGATLPERLAEADLLFREKRTVKEWVKVLKAKNVPYNPPGQTNMDAVVYGSSLLGPKIGNGFWQNLNGNFSPLTIDLWMRRTWGRLTGKSIGNPAALPAQRARLKEAVERSRSKDHGNADVIAQVDTAIVAAQRRLERLESLPLGTGEKMNARAAEIRTVKADIDALQEARADYANIQAPEKFIPVDSPARVAKVREELAAAQQQLEALEVAPIPRGQRSARKAEIKKLRADIEKLEKSTGDEALLAYSRRLVAAWNIEYKRIREPLIAKYGPKVKVPDELQPTWVRAAKTVITNLGKPLDQVQNGTQRAQIEKAGAMALQLLADRGIIVTMADLQAALWYPEKELWGALTAELSLDEDGLPVVPPSDLNESYDQAFARILGERDGSGKELRPGSGGERAVAGQDAGPERPESQGRAGRFDPGIEGPEAETFGQDEIDGRPQSPRDGRRRYSSGGLAPLEGAPVIKGATGPDPAIVAVAEQYAADNGIDLRRQARYADVDPDLATRIAAAYDAMPHAPEDPAVRAAYEDLARQTRLQYDALIAAGYVFTFYDDSTDPYAGNPAAAMRDLRTNKSMAVYGTYAGFGTEGVPGNAVETNVMLADTGLQWPDQNGVMQKVTSNDLFRAVHDAFGHSLEGAGFRARGEENAWQAHIRLYTGAARGAVTGETRGQNSWLNYGPNGEQNATASVQDTVFAPNKTGLMPEWTWAEGIVEDAPDETFGQPEIDGPPEQAPRSPYFNRRSMRPEGPAGPGEATQALREEWRPLMPAIAAARATAEDAIRLAEQARTPQQVEQVKAALGTLRNQVSEMRAARGGAVTPEDQRIDDILASLEPTNDPIFMGTQAFAARQSLDRLGQSLGFAEAGPRGRQAIYEEALFDLRGDAPLNMNNAIRVITEPTIAPDGTVLRKGVAEAVTGEELPVNTGRSPARTVLPRGADAPTETRGPGRYAAGDTEPGYQARGRRGEYSPRLKEIRLNASADFSTFLHELGHHFLEVYDATALTLRDKEAAGETLTDGERGVLDDTRRLLAELARQTNTEVEGDVLDWWRGRAFEDRVQMHEQFARLTEAYFLDGKAPTPEMQSMFQTFKRWMLQVYSSLTELDVELNDEVRGILDRMVAAEADIKTAEENRGLNAMFATKPAFMTDEEWRGYQQLALAATQAAEDELTARSLRDMKWLSRAKAREIRKLQKEAAEQRAIVEAAVTAEVMSQPINRARTFLRKGINPDGTEVQGPHKLSIEMLKAAYPDGEWKKLGYGRYGMLGKEGIDAEMAAELFGFESGDALIRALLDAEPAEATIEGETDRRMLEDFGDLVNEEAINRAADEALHNALRGRVLSAEYAALAKASGQRKMMAAAAQQIAKQVIGKQNAAKLKPQVYIAAERSAARKAEQALRRNDLVGAATAKRDQLLNFELAREAQRVLKQRNRTLDLFRQVTSAKRDTVSKTRNYDLVQVARAILAAHGMGQVRNAPIEYLDLLKRYDPRLYTSLEATLLVAMAKQKTIADLSVDEFLGLGDLIGQLWTLSREEKQIEIEGRKVELEQITTELTSRLATLGDTERGQIAEAATDAQKNMRSFVGLLASLRRVESWARSMDGGVVGPFTKYMFRPISEAADRYRADRNRLITKFRELFVAIEPTMGGKKIAAPELSYTFKNKAELLHAILHTGNASNKRKLLLGRQWGAERPDGTLDDSSWQKFLARMAQDGTLTKADFDFAQGVWDLLEETKPLAQATHRKVFGRYFAEITAEEVQTPFGTYRGGYVPAIYDQFFVGDAAVRAQQEQVEANDSTMFPSPASGFTKGRVEYNEVLELNLQLLPMHIDRVLKFAHLASPVRDVLRILRDREFARGLEQVDPTAQSDMLLPWLQRASRQIVEEPSKGQAGRLADQFFRGVRNRSGMGLMFANLVNVAQQFTGFPLVLLRVKPQYVGAALARYVANPARMTKAARGASLMMVERGDNQMSAMYNAIEQIIDKKNLYGRTADWLGRHTYFMQQAVQNVMDVIVWTGGYDQALARGESEAEAARQGDAAVRETQGSVFSEDIARIETGPAWARTFTHMYSYFSMWGNLLGSEVETTMREVGLRKGAGRLMFVYMIGFLAPAITAQLVADALRGQLPEDEEDDGYLDNWLSWFFMTQAKTAIAFAPIVGQAANATIGAFTAAPYDDRVGGSPAISAIEGAVRTPASVYEAVLAEGDKSRAVKDTLNLMTLLTGIPFQAAARPIGYAVDVAEGDIEPTSDLDYLRGLATGTASEASR